ncbi:MAG: hypothetical protein ACLQMF_18925 [Rectinemataceae bacterium]
MTHKERVTAALTRESPDRCPMQISFAPEFAERLSSDMGLIDKTHNPHGGGNSYVFEHALGVDIPQTSVGRANCQRRVALAVRNALCDDERICGE